ncbi:MAG: hypothetical protein ABIK09_19195 [Pseudomonadota bacterium]
MTERSLQPTVIQEVRIFLHGAGLAQRPWSGAPEVLRALLDLLDEKRDDPAFWGPLAALLARLAARQEDLDSGPDSLARDAEVLGAGELRALVTELRGALPGENGQSRQPLVSVLRNLRAPALASVLLLLAAGGCDVGGAGPVGDSAVDVARGADWLTDGQDPVLKDVFDYLAASNLPASTRKALEECLKAFSDTRRQDLVELFESKTPEEIAKHLEALASSTECQPGIPEKDIKPDLAVPLYKGISFPRP